MNLRPKLTLAFVLVAAASLAFVAVLGSLSARSSMLQRTLNQLETVAEIQEHRTEAVLEHNRDRIQLVAHREDLVRRVEERLAGAAGAWERLNATLLEVREAVDDFQEVFVLDEGGLAVASTDPARVGADLAGTPYAEAGRAGPRGDILLRDEAGEIWFYLAAPLARDEGVLGVVVIRAAVRPLLALVHDYAGLGATGETQLARLTAEGDALFLLPLRFDPDAALSRTVAGDDASAAVIRALQGVEGTHTGLRDYRGADVVAATRHLDGTGWGLVVKVDEAEVLAPWHQLNGFLLLAVLAALGGVVLASHRVVGVLTRPIKDLMAATGRLERGDQASRAAAGSSDELGQLATAFNEMARVVEEREAELARSNEELERFAYVASHDLQEPLRMVTGYLQLLKRRYQGQLDQDADEFIEYAVDGARRMKQMMNDLLTYSRLGRGTPQRRPVDLQAVVKEALDNLSSVLEETDATVTWESLPTVVGDASQLAQLLQNLLANALKYRGESSPRVRLSARPEDGEWTVSVQDNGVGIDPEYLDRIFLPFERLDTEGTPRGSGLGLAIARRIVEQHGGRLWVESTPGEGSTFHFTLPRPSEEDGGGGGVAVPSPGIEKEMDK